MNIIIAGVGKIGRTLAKQLAAEGHDLTLIDEKNRVLEGTVEAFDAMGACGNCASMEVLKSAGIENTDLVIAVTNADEVNLLCCLTAHGLNPKVMSIELPKPLSQQTNLGHSKTFPRMIFSIRREKSFAY